MIGVKNTSGKRLVARFDGQDYTFEPDVTTALAEDAARHIFGYGEKNKQPALLRLGWLPNGAAIEEGMSRLAAFQFLAVEDIKFKAEAAPAPDLPRRVSNGTEENRPLSEEELAHAQMLNDPEPGKAQFRKK